MLNRNGDSTERTAYSLPDFMFARQVLRVAELEVFCQTRHCMVKLGDFPFADYDGEEVPQAAGLTIHLRSRIFDFAEDDDVDLMQRTCNRWTRNTPQQAGLDMPGDQNRSEQTAFAFNPDAPAFDPNTPNVATLPENIQDLAHHWMVNSFSWEGEAPSTLAKTWFVDHHDQRFWTCHQPRPVRLYDEIQYWEATLKQAWRDHVDLQAQCLIQVVMPNPPNIDAETSMHVLLIQRPIEALSTILVTVLDISQPPGGIVMQLAVTTPEHLHVENLIAALGLAGRCLVPGAPMLCQVSYNGYPLPIGQVFPARDGQHILIQMTRRPAHQNVRPQAGPALIQTRQVLQSGAHAVHNDEEAREERLTTDVVAHAQWPSRLQCIRFAPVIRMFEWLDTHFFLPQFDLPEVVHPHPAANWIQNWWNFQTPGWKLRIYFDGSFHKAPEEGHHCAGAAIAAFILTDEGWAFAGALSSALPQMGSSYTAELAGAMVAHKFAYDLLKVHATHHGYLPEVTFCYDALTIGHQAQGDWSSISHPLFGRCLRDLALLLEQRYQTPLTYQHVRGHTGEPGNELVDCLANSARQHGGWTPFADWLHDMTQPDAVAKMDWMWILCASEFAKLWEGTDLKIPGPCSTPIANIVPTESSTTTSTSTPDFAEIRLRLASCNVLSLKGGRDVLSAQAGIARQQALLQQLREEEITIFALQETRLRKLHQTVDENYHLLKAAATDGGHGGILVGISKTQPYAQISSQKLRRPVPAYFHDDHLKIVAFDHRYLIVRVATPYLRCLIVAAHAPHTGHDAHFISDWWDQLCQAIPTTLQAWPILLLTDANAAVGATTSQHIGDYQAAKEDPKAEAFEAFLSRNDLWLPATFEAYQKGHGATWTHTSGSSRRIDYIGMPLSWNLQHCQTWVSETIDPTIIRADHSAVCAEATFTLARHTSGFTADRARETHLKVDPNAIDWTGLHQQCPHELDVHTHFQQLQDALVHHLRPQQRRQGRRPLKQTLSAHTWELVCTKRHWRRSLAEHTTLQKKTLLEACFAAWRHGRSDLATGYSELLALQDKLIAQALAQFRLYGRLVTAAMRQDDRAFFQGLLQDGADFLNPKDVKQLWAVIRRSLPKFRNRKVGYSPYKLAHLEEQSAHHFEALEMGIPTSPADLLTKCIQDQIVAAGRDLPPAIDTDSLPSLPDLEDALRATQADRATGFDAVPSSIYHKHAAFLGRYFYQVVLKMFVWGTEPVQGKGGFLKMIPKRQGAIEAKHFRGILLLPTLAKRVHAIARARLMRQAGHQRDPAQLGGYAGQQVAFGAHTLRALTNIFSARGMSSAVLYVDLATAFHHLVRQLVTGVGDDADWNYVLDALNRASTPVAAQREGMNLVGVLDKLRIDPVLIRLLKDIHASTWYTLAGNDLVRTLRGTRPGSPLADAIFHLLMTEIATDLREWLRQQPYLCEVLQQMGLDPVFIIWSDDFAIPIVSSTAENLVEEVIKLTQKVFALFTAKGFTVNFEAGKTSAVLTFVGPKAPEMRREHLLQARPGVDLDLGSNRRVWLHFCMKYKHLGALFSSSHSFEPELCQRIGTARSTFQLLYRAVLGNRHYPLALRLRFFNALVCSKLFFGMGAWTTPTIQQLGRLRTAFNDMLRKVCRNRADEMISNNQLLISTRSIDVRIRLAVDRLLYAQKLFQRGPAQLQQLMHLEKLFCGDQAWLCGLQADLQWLHQVLRQALPSVGVGDDLTDLIDFWQQGAPQWRNLIKRATKRHLLQEEIMNDALTFHKHILRDLRAVGATFDPDEGYVPEDRNELHHCICGRTFASSQGLALHRRKQHGHHAPEHQFVTGATCPACLRFFWTSNRLAMHLAYVPRGGGVNPCFDRLSKAQFVGGFYSQKAPATHAHAVRLDAVQAAGPRLQWVDHRQNLVDELTKEIGELVEKIDVFARPHDHLAQGLRIGEALTKFTQCWVQQCRQRGREELPDLLDGWIQLLSVHGDDFEEWVAFVFQQWGEHLLPDIIAELFDGEIEYELDEQFAEMAELFPRTARLRRLAQLRQLRCQLESELRQPALPHRPVRRGTANHKERAETMHKIGGVFHEQGAWQDAFRTIKWDFAPSCNVLPTIQWPDGDESKPCLLAVHLFSGRRRHGDLHWQLQQWAPRLGVRFVVLSMDTAVSPWYGDLWHTSTAWKMVLQCYERGLVALTMVGSPCETFSEARFTKPPPGDASRWPRPLRSAEHFFGLPDISNKELRQAHIGTNFYLQGMKTLGSHIAHGGLYISEHPGIPTDPARPTIWRAPMTELLRQHPDVHLNHVSQWQWGAGAVKPTGLLAHRLPRLLASLYSCSLPDVVKPTVAAIGKSPAGEFRTANLKEYPVALSAGLAKAFCDQVRADMRAGHLTPTKSWSEFHGGTELLAWVQEAAAASAAIRNDASVLPDYQPR